MSSPAMTPTTFPRFGELPKELQVHIWVLAFASDANPHLDEGFLHQVHSLHNQNFIGAIYLRFIVGVAWLARNTTWCQFSQLLMSTCYLSRQVVLEWWAGWIRSTSVGVWFSKEAGEVVKEKLAKEIDMFIVGREGFGDSDD